MAIDSLPICWKSLWQKCRMSHSVRDLAWLQMLLYPDTDVLFLSGHCLMTSIMLLSHPSFKWSLCFLLTLSCTMRVGRGIHPEGMPGWCQAFSLDGGSGVRALKVIQHGNRPGLIYNIGRWCWEPWKTLCHSCWFTMSVTPETEQLQQRNTPS